MENKNAKDLQKKFLYSAREFIYDFMKSLGSGKDGSTEFQLGCVPTVGVIDMDASGEHLLYAGSYDGGVYYFKDDSSDAIDIDDMSDEDMLAIVSQLALTRI